MVGASETGLRRMARPVSNRDLWQELDRLLAVYQVQWVSAKGDMYQGEAALAEAAKLAVAAVETAT